MRNRTVIFRCGVEGICWRAAWNAKREYMKVSLIDLYGGSMSIETLFDLISEIKEMGYTGNDGISLECGYYDNIDDMWLTVYKDDNAFVQAQQLFPDNSVNPNKEYTAEEYARILKINELRTMIDSTKPNKRLN